MTIEVRCTHCGAKRKTTAKLTTYIQCFTCGKRFQVLKGYKNPYKPKEYAHFIKYK